MASVNLRLRYEDGHFVPLDKVAGLNDGDEIEVQWTPPMPLSEDYQAMLDHTRGLWADLDDVEDLIADAREKWDEEWFNRLSSL
jgi:hypothetical protein